MALVTGASRGIGLEVARQLGQRGMSIFLGVRNTAKAHAAAEALRAEGIVAEALVLDVATSKRRARARTIHWRYDSAMPDYMALPYGRLFGLPSGYLKNADSSRTDGFLDLDHLDVQGLRRYDLA